MTSNLSSARVVAVVVAVVVVSSLAWIGPAPARAAAADETGSLSGSVLTPDGKPAVGLALELRQEVPMDAGPAGGKKNLLAPGGAGSVRLQEDRPPNIRIVGRATVNKDGTFLMKNVPAGGFLLYGGSDARGWVYQPVEVVAGKEIKLGEIKMVKPR